MLLLLAMLDTSGGLLLIPILVLVTAEDSVQYYLLLSFMPFVLCSWAMSGIPRFVQRFLETYRQHPRLSSGRPCWAFPAFIGLLSVHK